MGFVLLLRELEFSAHIFHNSDILYEHNVIHC